ncbi:PLP-dependent aminotransferase family protein [Massilia sp. ZL223]|nr:PLP-dependent aminotransferase family protein [Massilia sp. ZL223]
MEEAVLMEDVSCKHKGAAWPQLDIDRGKRGGLVDQIVAAISAMVSEGQLGAGTKMPSVRQFAKYNAVSTFTVVEAYERLHQLGLLSSRRGSGFFVARPQPQPAPVPSQPGLVSEIDALAPDLYSGQAEALPVGAGWLPPEWYGENTILDAVRHAMKIPAGRLRGYGHPLGFPALRQQLAASLSSELFPVDADQILLTHGATHAFDLVLRTLTRPGDVVFVEDPGYSNLLALIRHHGCVPVGVHRGAQGLDLDELARQAGEHHPKLMFVNTVLQNPLGTSLTQRQAHHLLGLAEQFDFWLVEDDIYRELALPGEASLAAMDGLRRVIRVGSFSKTLSPVLRVGSLCASASLLPELLRVKMVAGLTTSEINERAVLDAIGTRGYRRMVERLARQLADARERTLESLRGVGMAPLAQPRGGMFVSAGWLDAPIATRNGRGIADAALKAGILLAPGEFFTQRQPQGIWFRFNAAYADDERLLAFLRTQR